MSHRTTNVLILIGAILVGFVCSILLVSSALFAAGVVISWFHIPLAAALAAGFGWWIAKFYFPKETVPAFGFAFGSSVVVFVSFALLNGKIYDISWDGQWYHSEAILQLANGWNPFYDATSNGTLVSTLLNFYAKGPWICAAALYKFSGNFEAGKAFHLSLILACWLFSLAALSTFRGIRWQWSIMLSLLWALNPVSLCQVFTYYVDGQLASLLGIALSLLILIDRRPDRVLMAVLALLVILMINVKLNGAIYIAIIGGGYWLWAAIVKKARNIELAMWLIAGGVVGGVVVGFNPYVTQFVKEFISTGNPFYPTDYRSLTHIDGESPFRNFVGMNRVEKLFVSLFSKSEILPRHPLELKLPFTFSQNELQSFMYPDVRVGGFGPLFSGALVLTCAVLVILVVKYSRQLVGALTLLLPVMLILISAVSNPEMWWARYIPQLWIIPVVVASIGLLLLRGGQWRYLTFALLLTLYVNILLISFVYASATIRGDRQIAGDLTTLKNDVEPIAVRFNGFASTRYRFEQEGIRYIEFETLPCPENQRVNVVWSQAIICRRR